MNEEKVTPAGYVVEVIRRLNSARVAAAAGNVAAELWVKRYEEELEKWDLAHKYERKRTS